MNRYILYHDEFGLFVHDTKNNQHYCISKAGVVMCSDTDSWIYYDNTFFDLDDFLKMLNEENND